jgi:hypothetical protein
VRGSDPAQTEHGATILNPYLPVGKGVDSLEEALGSEEVPFVTPSLLAVSGSSLPVSLSPLAFWNALSAWVVWGPITPSIEPGSCPLFFIASLAFLKNFVAHL